LQQPTDEEDIRSALEGAGIDNPEVQATTGEDRPPNTFQVSTEELQPSEVELVENALDEEFGLVGQPDSQSVGPTFGETVARSAIIAIIASLIVVSVYLTLRFEFKYAVPVLIALCHDLLITGGVYAFVGREVTASTVAALLTILGFSLYDTIIVFDRIRENVPRMPRAAFSQIVNRSLSEVLVRSLATSFCTALPVFTLLLFGGDTLKDFAFALLVGTISGTYSSVFIAGPVLNHWKEREPAYRKRAQRILDSLGYIPAYATSVDGKPIDVPLPETERKRRSVLSSDEAEQVSAQEFQEMVRDIEHETQTRPAATKVREERQAPAARPEPEDGNGGDAERARDLSPDELYLKDEGGGTPKRRRPRNKKHGRR
jgi:SecD/SecF fusion protein